MLHFLPAPLLGVIAFTLIALNTCFWFTLFIPVIIIKVLFKFHTGIRRACSVWLMELGQRWVLCNSGVLAVVRPVEWDIEGLENLDMNGSYLLVSNHQTWTDIFVLQHIFHRRIPFLKFFLKQELIWVPLLGAAWWALDFPFMKRYSREQIAKNPSLRGKDIATTRTYCERFKDYPVSVINFLEGTRRTPAKLAKSPYRHLLKPKAGGIALVLAAMGDYLTEVLDVTLLYPDNPGKNLIGQLLQGKIKRIVVRIRRLPVPANTAGRDYQEDPEFQAQIQNWVNTLWEEKDALIEDLEQNLQRPMPLSAGS